MGQVHVSVTLTNARETVMAQLGQLSPDAVHTYQGEALVDTGATRSVLPPFVAEQLGLVRLSHTDAQYADGRVEEVDVSEPFLVEVLGRQTSQSAMIVGTHILLGVTVLEELDLLVDCRGQKLIPNPSHPDQPVFRV